MSLAVIIPFRDRSRHARQMLPALLNYLCDQIGIEGFRVLVVEQAAGKAFNAGLLRNIGAREAVNLGHATLCFHDIDYIPIDANYTAIERPTRLIWNGLRMIEDYEAFFGGVVALPATDFAAVNGYPNAYWGWGPEDLEFAFRCKVAGLSIDRRDGTFRALQHPHRGLGESAEQDAEVAPRIAMFDARRPLIESGLLLREDGLSTIRYREIGRRKMVSQGAPKAPFVWHITVEV